MSKRSNSKRSSIFRKILVIIFITVLIPLGGLGYTIYKSQQDRTTAIFQDLTATSNILVNYVSGWVDMNLRGLQQNAVLEDMISMHTDQQDPILKTIADTYEWTYLAFTIGRDGQNIGRSDGKKLKYYGDRDYFQQVMDGKPLGQQVLIGKTSKKPAFILAQPINDSTNQVVGVIAIAMTLVEMSKAVTDVRIGETGFAILLDHNNKVIAHGKSNNVKVALSDLSYHPALQITNKNSKEPIVYNSGDKKFVAYAQKTPHGWTLIVQQDYEEAFATLRQTQLNSLIILVFTLLLVGLVSSVLSRRLTAPIAHLTAVADDMSHGELKAKITGTQRSDEIGALARAIERLGISLNKAMQRIQPQADSVSSLSSRV